MRGVTQCGSRIDRSDSAITPANDHVAPLSALSIRVSRIIPSAQWLSTSA